MDLIHKHHRSTNIATPCADPSDSVHQSSELDNVPIIHPCQATAVVSILGRQSADLIVDEQPSWIHRSCDITLAHDIALERLLM